MYVYSFKFVSCVVFCGVLLDIKKRKLLPVLGISSKAEVLVYQQPHSYPAACVSSYYCMCPYTAIYVSLYYYMCPHPNDTLFVCPHTSRCKIDRACLVSLAILEPIWGHQLSASQ